MPDIPDPGDSTVSAIITTRNRSALLERAVNSVLRQSFPVTEILIVDDASTDDTPVIVEQIQQQHSHVIYLRNDTRRGASASRNIGIRAAGGKYIAGLDDDDEWHARRIEKLLAAARPSFSCVTSDAVILTGTRSRRWRKKKVISLSDLLYSNQVGNQVLVERARMLDIGGFDETLDAAQDYDVWIRLCERFGPIRNVREPLQIIHMEHELGRITSGARQFRGYMQFFNKHRRRMNRSQRKYQLYLIRKKTGRTVSFRDSITMVPPRLWAKAFKAWLAERVIRK